MIFNQFYKDFEQIYLQKLYFVNEILHFPLSETRIPLEILNFPSRKTENSKFSVSVLTEIFSVPFRFRHGTERNGKRNGNFRYSVTDWRTTSKLSPLLQILLQFSLKCSSKCSSLSFSPSSPPSSPNFPPTSFSRNFPPSSHFLWFEVNARTNTSLSYSFIYMIVS